MDAITPVGLMDAAWVSIKNGDGLWTRVVRRAMKNDLLQQFPNANENQLSHACYMAKSLLDACYETGDLCRSEAITHGEAKASLQEKCPGFSDEIYAQAVSFGMYSSR